MLQFIVISLCIPSSLALIDSIHDTKDTGDLFPLARRTGFHKNFVDFAVYNDLKTGENISEPCCRFFEMWRHFDNCTVSDSTRFGTAFSARRDHMYYGLYWEQNFRDEDQYPDEEAVACAYIDLDKQLIYQNPELVSDQSRLEVGQSKTSENGTVRVKCSRFDGHVRRVSEAFSGCYYNETVYQIHDEWEEPNPGNDSSLWRKMSCQRSENGFFDNKLVGCSFHEIHNFTNDDNSVVTWVNKREYRLNDVFRHYHEKLYKSKMYEFQGCKIGKDNYVPVNTAREHQLPNGCKFICHPQTNFFKCDESLSMFKIEGKPRKMRKYEGVMPGHPKFRFGW
ncbi:hypothetical protein B9Z55_012596 [Caenorhabditis nigoni]|uniref:Uncharacterized protein n=1 Tax=Caenorhabditis nigoni TaxID=1611254 RepID=A0A2G5TXZ9_9PELO|nr:hypothetical protein B9Z55_012596 [Caenorhabditis nigoni]